MFINYVYFNIRAQLKISIKRTSNSSRYQTPNSVHSIRKHMIYLMR